MIKLCECGCGEPTPLASITSKAKGWIAGQPIRFIQYHYPRTRPASDPKYFEKYYAENKETILAKNKAYRKKDPAKTKAQQHKTNLWVKYRITPEEQVRIDEFEAQHPVYKLLVGKRMGTDHDHKTGLIRGRLEWRLNRAYGLVERVCPTNTAAVLRALADFHENPPATTVLGGKRFGLIGQAQYKKKMVYGSENGPIKAVKKERKCKKR